MTVTLPMWGAFALTAGGFVWGLILTVCAMLGPRPARTPAADRTAPDPLPRAGRLTLAAPLPAPEPGPPPAVLYDTTPLILMSEHYAYVDATGREADRMDAAWRDRYLP